MSYGRNAKSPEVKAKIRQKALRNLRRKPGDSLPELIDPAAVHPVKNGGKFKPGNKFWEARSSRGRKPIFETPESLWDACLEYFEWIRNNPLQTQKLFSFQGQVIEGIEYKMFAMTLDTLLMFLDINILTWYDYAGKNAYGNICAQAEAVIKAQKFSGAAADLLNPNIIARDLGLVDRAEVAIPGVIRVVYDEATDPDPAE